jgi:hypothetical protein
MALVMMVLNPPAPWQDLKPAHRAAFLQVGFLPAALSSWGRLGQSLRVP